MKAELNLAALLGPHGLLAEKTAEYRRLAPDGGDSDRKQGSATERRAHTVRIKKRPQISAVLLKPSLTHTPPTSRAHSSSDMFSLLYHLTLSRATHPSLPALSQSIPVTPPSRLRHPLLANPTPPSDFKRKLSAWSQVSSFKAITQKGRGVKYAVGRKNWLRDNAGRVRAATIKKSLETHR